MPSVLLIEDEAAIADNVQFVLKNEGFACTWVNEAVRGIESLSENEFQLIILDIGLPDMNGFDLLKEIRKISNIPVIILTARAEEIDKVLGLEIGADDYVVKPFSPRELAARVKANIRRQENANSVPNNGFNIDENRQCIFFQGKDLNLSRYEFKILELLLKRPGWVFSREKIMHLVWQEPEESFERTVDTHIKTIRQKIKAIDTDTDVIKTHRGLGYSFSETT